MVYLLMAEKKFQFAAAGFAGLATLAKPPISTRERGFCRLHDMLDGEAEILEKLAGGRGFAKRIDAHPAAFETHVLTPEISHTRFDRDAHDALRQLAVAILLVLQIERVRTRHGHDACANAFLRQFLAGLQRQ